ncbi:MAG: aminoglycoside 6-adenylyltransferase [Nocardioides sp.]|nr:aminoglycoside 6-adenylyltransferase [Nocardioides sp.]
MPRVRCEDVSEAIAPLDPGYADLLDRVVDVAADDERVRAMWLTGSVGRGVADAGSDLDVVLTVTDPAAYGDPITWAVLDPVITTPIPGRPGCRAFTTRLGLRLDLLLETPADLPGSPYTHRVRVLDRDGLEPPAPVDDRRGPDLGRMQELVTEFLRQSAIFPAAVVAREDWLLGQVAVHNYQRLLYDLVVESNRPLPSMGIKQWSRRLTPEQRDLLSALPAPAADRDSVVRAMAAAREALRTHGRAALEAAGGVWPDDVDAALAAYWERQGL